MKQTMFLALSLACIVHPACAMKGTPQAEPDQTSVRYAYGPWRYGYRPVSNIKEEAPATDSFCKLANGDKKTRNQNIILSVEEQSMALLNFKPYTPEHVIGTTREHKLYLDEVSAPTLLEQMLLIKFCSQTFVEQRKRRNITLLLNMGDYTGASVPHVHPHMFQLDDTFGSIDEILESERSEVNPVKNTQETMVKLFQSRSIAQEKQSFWKDLLKEQPKQGQPLVTAKQRLLYLTQQVRVELANKPEVEGHIQIIPHQQTDYLHKHPARTFLEMFLCANAAAKIVREKIETTRGVNLTCRMTRNGKTVLNVLPRREGDAPGMGCENIRLLKIPISKLLQRLKNGFHTVDIKKEVAAFTEHIKPEIPL